jgi:hypothetical protein
MSSAATQMSGLDASGASAISEFGG